MRREHPEARRWREIAEGYQRQVQALLFELARVGTAAGIPVDLNPPLVLAGDRFPPINCDVCGELIERYGSNGNARHYCGHACQMRAWRQRRAAA